MSKDNVRAARQPTPPEARIRQVKDELGTFIEELQALHDHIGREGRELTKEQKELIRTALAGLWLSRTFVELRFAFMTGATEELEYITDNIHDMMRLFA